MKLDCHANWRLLAMTKEGTHETLDTGPRRYDGAEEIKNKTNLSFPRRRGSIAFWLLLALDSYTPLSSRGATAAIQSVNTNKEYMKLDCHANWRLLAMTKEGTHETLDTGLRRYDGAEEIKN